MPVRVKICGITRVEDAQEAARAGASAIGMVFWPGSPRCVSVERAAEIAAAVPPGVMKVGVFVNQERAVVEQAVRRAGLDAVQLHGRENPSEFSIGGVLLLKSIPMDGRFELALNSVPPGVLPLLDAPDDERKGGTGTRVDWRLAASAAAVRRIVLAGGLTPSNVRDAIRAVMPFAVDVSSGVETSAGRKSADRIRAFVSEVRQETGDIPRGYWV